MLRPFFSYYGGKWRAAPSYPAPEHRTIIEPFAGSAGYSLRYPDRDVILIDSNPVVVGVWSFLIGSSSEDINRLPLLEPGQSVDDLAVCQEARWLIGFWLHRGTTGPDREATWFIDPPYTKGGQRYSAQVASRVDLAAWCRSRRGLVVVCESYGASWLPFERLGTMKAMSGRRRRGTVEEAVWIERTNLTLAPESP